MTIAEKNKRIAELVYPDKEIRIAGKTSAVWYSGGCLEPSHYLNYYNSWNDLMPLIDELGLKIETFNRSTHVIARVVTTDNTKSFTSKGSDLQHALGDCLLKILEERSK